MVRHASLFRQLITLFDRKRFHELVYRHQSERYAKKIQFLGPFRGHVVLSGRPGQEPAGDMRWVGLLSGQAASLGLESGAQQIHPVLRQHAPSLANVPRSFLRNADFLPAGCARQTQIPIQKQTPEPGQFHHLVVFGLVSLAKFRRTKGAVKLHLLLDHDGYLPSYAYISEGKKHDVTIARRVPLAPGSIVTMDRGYNDYRLFASWIENRIYFVTRLKDNADYVVVAENPVPQHRNIRVDELIQFAGYSAKQKCPHVLRRIVVWDSENEREIVLLTNHLEFGATTVAAIYKDRWQIEIDHYEYIYKIDSCLMISLVTFFCGSCSFIASKQPHISH